jgi:hypothetical protein
VAKKRLTWKREPDERGLAAVAQRPRGFVLSYGGVEVAYVYPSMNWRDIVGWYYVAGYVDGVPHRNTCRELVATPDEAKAACIDYVRAHLKEVG